MNNLIIFLWIYLFLIASLIVEMGIIRLAIVVVMTGAFIVWLVWATSWKSYKNQNWYCKIFTIIGVIIILIGCSVIPIYNVHQEYHEEEVVEITKCSHVIRITYVHNVPETTNRMWNGKVFIYRKNEGVSYEEVKFECYSESGELLNTFSSDELEIEVTDSEEQYLETKYKDSWEINHISDLLNIEEEMEFIKGECLNAHDTHSYVRVEEMKTLYININTIETQIVYVDE